MSRPHLYIGNKRYSSWSFRPWLLLKTAGIPFKETYIPIREPGTADAIAKISPAGKVPVLHDGAVRVWESLAICEYLAEKFPSKKLWPVSAKDRAEARSISNEMHAGFQGLRAHLPCHFLNRYENFQVPAEAGEDIARVQQIWHSCLRRHSKKGPFLFGSFSIADAMFAPVVFRFFAYGVKVDPACARYMTFIEGLPATREWVRDAALERERIAAYEPKLLPARA